MRAIEPSSFSSTSMGIPSCFSSFWCSLIEPSFLVSVWAPARTYFGWASSWLPFGTGFSDVWSGGGMATLEENTCLGCLEAALCPTGSKLWKHPRLNSCALLSNETLKTGPSFIEAEIMCTEDSCHLANPNKLRALTNCKHRNAWVATCYIISKF